MSERNRSSKADCLIAVLERDKYAATEANMLSVAIADIWLDDICVQTRAYGESSGRHAPLPAADALARWLPRNNIIAPMRAIPFAMHMRKK